MAPEPLEALLLRMAPQAQQQWEGASADEIDRIQQLAGQDLPSFYRWLLGRVGRNAGPLPEIYRAFYARNVIEAHRTEFEPDPPILFIARLDDPLFPLYLYYDLSKQVRDDAWVDGHQADGGLTDSTETLRELLAWMSVLVLRIQPSPQKCDGTFVDRDGDVSAQLTQAMTSLGFTEPIPTGSFCKIFERDGATLVGKVSAQPKNAYMLTFHFGGPDAGLLRRVLGEIALQTQIKITVSEWTPRVDAP
jgi:hypothetical protein